MILVTTRTLWPTVVVAIAITYPAGAAIAAANGAAIDRQDWDFSGPFGTFDKAQLQRGFQIYQRVCSACHGLKRVRFRNLTEPGGPEFPEESVQFLASEWPNQIVDGPNDDGEMFERPARMADPILGPYRNEKQARAAQGGANPPDLSLMAKARNPEYAGPVWWHPIQMLKDMVTAYQEGGADYIYALLTGYRDEAPAYIRASRGGLIALTNAEAPTAKNVERCASVAKGDKEKPSICTPLQEGMYYNFAFPGHQIAMAPPLGDGVVAYETAAAGKPNAPETLQQYARDISAFLSWAADPKLNARKRMGWQVLLYLFITTVLLYLGKKRIWARIEQ